MKFLNEKGEVVEGTVLTEDQINLRGQITQFAHEKVCGGSIHSRWSREHEGIPKCEVLANYFITKFKLTPLNGTDLAADIEAAELANMPQAIPDPAPTPSDVIPAASSDEIIF